MCVCVFECAWIPGLMASVLSVKTFVRHAFSRERKTHFDACRVDFFFWSFIPKILLSSFVMRNGHDISVRFYLCRSILDFMYTASALLYMYIISFH